MASEDNVVRLKHLQALAQTVADEIADLLYKAAALPLTSHITPTSLFTFPMTLLLSLQGSNNPFYRLARGELLIQSIARLSPTTATVPFRPTLALSAMVF